MGKNWTEHVARIRKQELHTVFYLEILIGQLEGRDVDGGMILK